MTSLPLIAAAFAGAALAAPQLTSSLGYYGPSVPTVSQAPTQTFYRGTGGVTITPNVTAYPTGTPTTTDACAKVAELSASFVAQSPSAVPSVPAQVGFDCLNSIPFNQSAASDLLDSIEPYLQWQTSRQRLADPPAEYAEKVQPPYDFLGTYAAIKANVSTGSYKSEYEFGWTLYRAFQLAHDGHFVYYPDSVTALISFGRRTPLISASRDGKEAPLPYLYSDVLASTFSNGSFTPSPIVKIDGVDATEYLEVFSEYGSLQDPDALYNNLFYEPAQVALGSSGTGTGTFSGGGRGRWPFPGATTKLDFENGTSLTTENYARVLQDFTGIQNGAQVYTTFLAVGEDAFENIFDLATTSTTSAAGNSTPTATAQPSSSPAATTIPAPGYPSPVVRQSQNLNSGYFLEGEGYEDVAVLAVNSFVGSTGQVEFQNVNSELIAAAKAAGKTKLIIDVSANGGGTILLGYDLFKQLFPSILPYGGNRFRYHEAYNLIGEQDSYLAGLFPRTLDQNQTVLDIESSTFNYRTDADINYEPFTSWAEKAGPVQFGPNNDNFSEIIRWNLSDPLTPENSGGIYVSGYLNRSNVTTQPFATEDIIIVYDGYCASTCTIFSELMRQQAGVKTIALGGRSNTDIIQAVGGIKGNSLLEVYQSSNASLQEAWQQTVVKDYTQLPLFRATNYVVNARDGFRQNDTSNVPLQFQYEAADCRVLYTPEMTVDQSAVWRTVADTVWGTGDACVAGSNDFYGGKYKRSIGAGVADKKFRKRSVSDGISMQGILDSFSLETENLALRGAEGVMIP